ncbi:hypothetical protein Syun_010856 [Stephania yunnanensis]|uniref:Pentatricopeptide repeat-containing protein n=1 Tax=Stephania yunnanensis TaxID=152371 RepID=A0AAP0JWG4_9MAGN
MTIMASAQCLTLLERCSSMKELRAIHAHLVTSGFSRFAYFTSRLLASCALSDFGVDMSYAQCVFDAIQFPSIFNWNTMIKGYSQTPIESQMGLVVYVKMRRIGVDPNMHTFPMLLKACDGLTSLSQVHSQLVKFAMNLDVYAISSLIKAYSKYGAVSLAHQALEETPNSNVVCWTSLVSGYCAHGRLEEARQVFDQMPERNDASWSAMISGYVQNDHFNDAIELFRVFKDCCLKPNRSLMVSVLNACGALGAFEEGRWIHSYVDANELGYGLELGTALVDFYSKCGHASNLALPVFEKMRCKDVMSWTAMITGLAINGYADLALKLFGQMENSAVDKPNAVTFIGVLAACNHGGLVDEGEVLFESMHKDYGIPPVLEHYGCMVDLLGRAGRFEKAEELIKSMPMEADGIVWGALLNGCIMHGNFELGEKVGKHLIELEPQHSGRYALVANMYGAMGRWEDALEMRRLMRERGVSPVLGWSFIEVDGSVHRFVVDDKSHFQLNEIHNLLHLLNKDLNF